MDEAREALVKLQAEDIFRYLNSSDPFFQQMAREEIGRQQVLYCLDESGQAGEVLTRLQAIGLDVELVPEALREE